MASNTEAPKELKKLAFVVTYASFLVRFSQRGYTGIRAFVPTAAISSLIKVEEFAAERSAPFVLRAMDAGGAALTFADEKVSGALGRCNHDATESVYEEMGCWNHPLKSWCLSRVRPLRCCPRACTHSQSKQR